MCVSNSNSMPIDFRIKNFTCQQATRGTAALSKWYAIFKYSSFCLSLPFKASMYLLNDVAIALQQTNVVEGVASGLEIAMLVFSREQIRTQNERKISQK